MGWQDPIHRCPIVSLHLNIIEVQCLFLAAARQDWLFNISSCGDLIVSEVSYPSNLIISEVSYPSNLLLSE